MSGLAVGARVQLVLAPEVESDRPVRGTVVRGEEGGVVMVHFDCNRADHVSECNPSTIAAADDEAESASPQQTPRDATRPKRGVATSLFTPGPGSPESPSAVAATPAPTAVPEAPAAAEAEPAPAARSAANGDFVIDCCQVRRTCFLLHAPHGGVAGR